MFVETPASSASRALTRWEDQSDYAQIYCHPNALDHTVPRIFDHAQIVPSWQVVVVLSRRFVDYWPSSADVRVAIALISEPPLVRVDAVRTPFVVVQLVGLFLVPHDLFGRVKRLVYPRILSTTELVHQSQLLLVEELQVEETWVPLSLDVQEDQVRRLSRGGLEVPRFRKFKRLRLGLIVNIHGQVLER